MKKILIENWREIVGWLTILLFGYIYLFEINNIDLLNNRNKAFDFLVIVTIMVLAWLKLNKKRV